MLNPRRTMLATLLATGVTGLAAQGATRCDISIGIVDLDCVQCTVHSGVNAWVEYGAEPTIRRVASNTNDGLKSGDVVVSIDRLLVTTSSGGQRLARPIPGRPAVVTVRREGRPVTVNVMPTVRCPVSDALMSSPAIVGRSDSTRVSGRIVRTLNGDTVYLTPRAVAGAQARGTFTLPNGDSVMVTPRRAGGGGATGARAVYLGDTVAVLPRNYVAGRAVGAAGAGGGSGGRMVDSATAARLRDRLGAAVAARSSGGGAGYMIADSVAPRRAVAGGFGGGAGVGFATADSVTARGWQFGQNSAGGGAMVARRMTDSTAAQVAAGGFGGGNMVARRATDSVGAAAISRRGDEATGISRRGEGFAGGLYSSSSTNGWLGFGLECNNCSTSTDTEGRSIWKFSAAPAIAGVEPGSPAELAGLQIGDVVKEIDGVSMTWPAGATKFSTIKPGQKVKLTIVRGGKEREVVMTVGRKMQRT